MTEEQIKLNAEAYADAFCSRDDQTGMWQECCNIFIAGAHSLDEEMGTLEGLLKIKEHEIKQLRNPWISVEERLPEEGKDILLSYRDGIIVRLGCVRIGDVNFIKNHIQCYMCWMETPKPELKK